MPWTTKDVEKHKKGLTAKQKRQWVSVANSTRRRLLKKGSSEKAADAGAIRAANGTAGKKTKEGWIPKVVQAEGRVDNHTSWKRVTEETYFLSEAEFLDDQPDGKSRVVLKIIQGENREHNGISANKNYYSAKAIETLVPFLENRRKMMLDHKALDKLGRSLRDLTAIIEEVWVENAGIFVKAEVLINKPDTGWIYEVMKNYPTEVGVSINSMVRGSRGEVHKEQVFIVEKFTFLINADFVGEASAGGGFVSLAESHIEKKRPDAEQAAQFIALVESKTPEGEILMKFGEMVNLIEGEFADRLERSGRRSKFWAVGYILTDVLRKIASSDELEDMEKKKAIKDALGELATELDKLDLIDLFGADDFFGWESEAINPIEEAINLLEAYQDALSLQDSINDGLIKGEIVEFEITKMEGGEQNSEEVFSDTSWARVDKSKLPPSAFLIIGDPKQESTWHLPYRDDSGNVSKGAIRAISSVLGGAKGGAKFSVPKEVQVKITDLCEAMEIEEPTGAVETGTVKLPKTKEGEPVELEEIKGLTLEQLTGAGNPAVTELNQGIEGLNTTISEKDGVIKERDDTIETLQEEGKTKDAELDELKLTEAERVRVELVNKLLGESEIIDSKNEAHVSEAFRNQLLAAKDDEVIAALIKDREGIITEARKARTGKVEGNGSTPQDHGNQEDPPPNDLAYVLPVVPGQVAEGVKLPDAEPTDLTQLATSLTQGGTTLVG